MTEVERRKNIHFVTQEGSRNKRFTKNEHKPEKSNGYYLHGRWSVASFRPRRAEQQDGPSGRANQTTELWWLWWLPWLGSHTTGGLMAGGRQGQALWKTGCTLQSMLKWETIMTMLIYPRLTTANNTLQNSWRQAKTGVVEDRMHATVNTANLSLAKNPWKHFIN